MSDARVVEPGALGWIEDILLLALPDALPILRLEGSSYFFFAMPPIIEVYPGGLLKNSA